MMDFSLLKKLTINGVELKQLFINGIQVWKAGYKNWARYSTEADGVTIYNGGKGYKDGYRVRSGGAEGATSVGTCTGFIPVKGGDIVRISGFGFFASSNANAINGFDNGFTNLGQLVANFANGGYGIFAADGAWSAYSWKSVTEETTGVYKWVVPPSGSGIAYIRVSGETGAVADGTKMIVTINEEIS